MSLINSSGRPENPDPKPWMQKLQHNPVLVTLAVMVLGSVEIFARAADDGGVFDGLASVLNVMVLTLIVVWVIAVRGHMRGFCSTCFHQPLGGPRVAKRKVRTLRNFHLFTGNIKIYYAVLGTALTIQLLNSFFEWWGAPGQVLNFLFIWAGIGLVNHSVKIHDWLVPWCPWCRDDGGFGEEAPTPAPSGTKVTTS